MSDQETNAAEENVEQVAENIESQEVKAEVDAIDTFPADVERPTARQFVGTSPVLTIAVDGDVSEETLSSITEEIKDELDALSEITLTSFVAKKEKIFLCPSL